MASFLTKIQEESYWVCFCISSKPKLLEGNWCQNNMYHFLISLLHQNSISIEFYSTDMIFSMFFCLGKNFCINQYSYENFVAMEAWYWEISPEYWEWAKLPSWIFWLTNQLITYFFEWFLLVLALYPCSICTKWWWFRAFQCTWCHSYIDQKILEFKIADEDGVVVQRILVYE